MSGTPGFKVFDAEGNYVAAVRDASLAAALIGSALYEGARVKFNGRIIWREGEEEVRSGESFDRAAEIMHARVEANRRRF